MGAEDSAIGLTIPLAEIGGDLWQLHGAECRRAADLQPPARRALKFVGK
jgi:hypothetical protein